MTQQKYLIFGTGSAAEYFLSGSTAEEQNLIIGFIDNNPNKQGREFLQKEIFSPKNIKNISFDKIIIASIYYHEIKKQLIELDIPDEKIDSYLTFLPNNFSQFLYFEKNKNRLKNKDFSLISNSCFGLLVYRKLGLKYNSPFIGSFIPKKSYLKLMNNLEYYLKLDLNGDSYSLHKHVHLGPDVFFTFPHEKNFKVIYEKWNKRLERIDFSNLFFHTGFNYFYATVPEEVYTIEEAQKISYKNKLLVEPNHYYLTNNGTLTTPQKGAVDIISWLNKELPD